MAEPWLWNENDLLALVRDGVKESIELDYKGSGALDRKTDKQKDELSKDVSAMANSAGGTLVYGMLEDGHVPTGLDVGFDPAEVTKEWVEQVVNSRIQRRIDGVRVNSVELTTHAPGKVAYVIWVPQSVRAPHQAADKRFYKRFNFESVPMDEYEIRDVARRTEYPDLRLSLELVPSELGVDSSGAYLSPVEIHAEIRNESPEPASHAVIRMFFAKPLDVAAPPDWDLNRADLITVGTAEQQASSLLFNWAPPKWMPLFFGMPWRMTRTAIGLRIPAKDLGGTNRYTLGWRIDAPRMAPRWGGGALVLASPVISLVMEPDDTFVWAQRDFQRTATQPG